MSERTIPFVDLTIRNEELDREIDDAIRRVRESAWYVLGPEVEAFEAQFAGWLGGRYGVGVASGTDAISLALTACGVGPGHEVITSPLTATFTALAIHRIGAKPVFADVEESTLTLSAASVAERITSSTRAVVPVHLYGNACDLAALQDVATSSRLAIVEDACQAHGARHEGARLGTFGAAGTFSFYPTKNLGALGDGGFVVTDDEEIAATVRRARNGGQSSRYVHEEAGINSRLDEIQAAVLRAKLPYLERWNRRRREIADRYDRAFEDTALRPITARNRETSARHLYVARADDRDGLMERLGERGVGTLVHYPVPANLQPAFRHLEQGEGSCPVAEAAARNILSLPLSPDLTDDDADFVVDAVRRSL